MQEVQMSLNSARVKIVKCHQEPAAKYAWERRRQRKKAKWSGRNPLLLQNDTSVMLPTVFLSCPGMSNPCFILHPKLHWLFFSLHIHREAGLVQVIQILGCDRENSNHE